MNGEHALLIDMTGQRFGRLTVKSLSPREKGKARKWICICECGNEVKVTRDGLKAETTSCGCYRYERLIESKITHGKANTNEYRIWSDIKSRCFNQKVKTYKYYGGRGITMSDVWRNDFTAFLSDMGKRPSNKHTVERRDVNGNYEPSNCYWLTSSEQSRNRRTNNPFGQAGVYATKSGKFNVKFNRLDLGIYEKLEDAIRARKEAEIKHWGKEA